MRNQVRNFVAHGAFGKQGEAFLFHSHVGAVPVTMPHPEGKYSYHFVSWVDCFGRDRRLASDEAIALIERFIDYVRSGPLAPAWMYLDSGLDLVLTMAQSREYALAMASENAMEELVERLSYFNDRYTNMDF